jgi:hypothetical protein
LQWSEGYRWLANRRQSASLLGEPSRCIQVGDCESDMRRWRAESGREIPPVASVRRQLAGLANVLA